MKLAIFGATGALGAECVRQSLAAKHEVTALVRTPEKLAPEVRERITVIPGDALRADDVAAALAGAEAVLFAIGVDRSSPEDLCTEATRHIVEAMPRLGVRRLVWCGGGSTIVDDDVVTFGARFVQGFSALFLGLRHRDKAHQMELLERHREVEWAGVRPLQMRAGPGRGEYRLGFHPYSGLSKIHFADCAHAMIGMLADDTWLWKAPIVQY